MPTHGIDVGDDSYVTSFGKDPSRLMSPLRNRKRSDEKGMTSGT